MRQRRLKLTTIAPLFFGAILLLVLGLVTIISTWGGNTIIQQNLADSGRETLAVSAKLFFNPLYRLDVSTLDTLVNQFLAQENIVYVAVRDVDGRPLVTATEVQVQDEQISRDMAVQVLAQQQIIEQQIGRYLVLHGPVTAGTKSIGTIEIAFDQAPQQAAFSSVQTSITVAIMALFGITFVVLLGLSRYATAPLRELAVAAREIGQGNLDTVVPIRGTEETASLGIALEQMRTNLQQLYTGLEQRTAELSYRAAQLQTAAQVSRATTSVLDPDALLRRVVDLVHERFGLYYVGLFLLDRERRFATLAAGSGEAGRFMRAQGHKLEVGGTSMVGVACAQGQPRVALDVGAEPVRFDNPLLPDTRSELALPLLARGEVVGALDVQSTEPEAFSDQDITVLQTLADQVAVAISNARLFQQTQESLEAERRAYGELASEAWRELLRVQPDLGFLSDAHDTVPAGDLWRPEMEIALRTGETAPGDGDATTAAAVAIPIKVRGQVVGVVDGRKPDGAGEWTPEEIELFEALTDQLNLALESARLYRDTQRRAARERVLGEVTAHVRESLDLGTVLQTATDEMRQALGLERLVVRLGTPEADEPPQA